MAQDSLLQLVFRLKHSRWWLLGLGIFFLFLVSDSAQAGYDYQAACDGLVNNGSYYSQHCFASTTNNLYQNTNQNDVSYLSLYVPSDVNPSQIIVSQASAIRTGHFWGPGFEFWVQDQGGAINLPVQGVGAGQSFGFYIQRISNNMVFAKADITFVMYRKPGSVSTSCSGSPNPVTMSGSKATTTITGFGSDPWGGVVSKYAWNFGDGTTADRSAEQTLASNSTIITHPVERGNEKKSKKRNLLGLQEVRADGGGYSIPGPPVTMSASPASVTIGQNSTISWSVDAANATNVFTLTATNSYGSVSQTLTVPVTNLGDGSNQQQDGKNSGLAQHLSPPSTQETQSRQTLLGFESAKADGGGYIIPDPTGPPQILNFTYQNTSGGVIYNGSQVTLVWSTSGASSVSSNFGIDATQVSGSKLVTVSKLSVTSNFYAGEMPASGSAVVTPTFGNTYTVTAQAGFGVTTKSLNIGVVPPPVVHNYTQPGTYTVKVTSSSTSGNNGTGSCTVTVLPDPYLPRNDAQFISQTAPPTSMRPGQTATVSITMKNTGNTTWSAGSGFSLVSLTGNSWGSSSIGLGSSETVAPNATKTFSFTITAPPSPGTYNFQWQMTQSSKGNFGSPSTNVAVVVAYPKPALSFKVNGQASVTNLPSGSNVTLTWSSTEATGCTASGDWSGSKAVNNSTGEVQSNLIGPRTYSYTLTCTGLGGSQAVSATAQILPPKPRVELTASETTVNVGTGTTLTWKTFENPTSCTASGGSIGWSGAKNVSGGTFTTGPLLATTTYTMLCQNAGGSSAPASITINFLSTPPAVFKGAFAATGLLLQREGQVTLQLDARIQQQPPPGFTNILPPKIKEGF